MKIKKKNKGFTLVELLAALVILGLLTAIAAPNIIGILQSTKLNTYARDAEKLVTTAEYRFRSDTSIIKPAKKSDKVNGDDNSADKSKCIIMNMKYLGSSEFKTSPYGGSYTYSYKHPYDASKNIDTELNNFVVIKRVDSGDTIKYEYYVQLVEYIKDKAKYSGIPLTAYQTIKTDSPIDYVNTGISTEPTKVNETSPSPTMNVGGETCYIQARYAK